jgi:hypothetical protein
VEFAKPTETEFEALAAEHAARYPTKARVTVIGDNGAQINVPLVLGNPTPAKWSEILAVLLKQREAPEDFKEQVALSSVLWPDRKGWYALLARWPALPASVADLVMSKIGARLLPVSDEEPPPPSLAAALEGKPRARWRRLQTTSGAIFEVALEAPSPAAWRLFKEALTKKGADVAAVVRDACKASMLSCVSADAPADFERLVDEFPFVVTLIITEIGALAGIAESAALGEW